MAEESWEVGAAAPGGCRELSPTGKHVAYRLWRRPGPHWHVRECFPRTGGTTSPQIHARPKLRMWPNFKTGWTGVGAAPRSEGLVRSSEPAHTRREDAHAIPEARPPGSPCRPGTPRRQQHPKSSGPGSLRGGSTARGPSIPESASRAARLKPCGPPGRGAG